MKFSIFVFGWNEDQCMELILETLKKSENPDRL